MAADGMEKLNPEAEACGAQLRRTGVYLKRPFI